MHVSLPKYKIISDPTGNQGNAELATCVLQTQLSGAEVERGCLRWQWLPKQKGDFLTQRPAVLGVIHIPSCEVNRKVKLAARDQAGRSENKFGWNVCSLQSWERQNCLQARACRAQAAWDRALLESCLGAARPELGVPVRNTPAQNPCVRVGLG